MDELKHYGTPRKSGRYPWGSGEDPYQSCSSFIASVNDLKKKNLTEKQIADAMGITTTQLRARTSISKAAIRDNKVREAMKLKDKGYSNTAIGEKMGINESSVRSLLDPTIQARQDQTITTANMLKDAVKERGLIDIGAGVENHVGVSKTRMDTAISMLEDEGYTVNYIKVEQLGTGNQTTVKVLAPPDMDYSEVYKNRHDIKVINHYSEDSGRTFLGLEPINSVNSKRVGVRYDEDGGSQKDGLIEVRPGVEDLSLGNAKYAQVRIGVDGTHYIKGMAMYSDDLPDGVDIMFNTNKSKTVGKMGSLKDMKDDPDNPFGATVRQRHYIDKNGKKKLSAMNIVYEEGEWEDWSKSLSSQMLSKQSPTLIKKQLGIAYDKRQQEYDDIMGLTNPVVRRKLLETFSDGADSAAVHLKAAALPRQGTHVILPFPKMKDNEIYAPKYRDGEKVVLIRHPHGGIFEIPELTVNNRQSIAKKALGQAKDAVGINHKVAERLSGADFDGDTVLVIPNKKGSGHVKTSAPLKALQTFDPRETYKETPGMTKMTKHGTQRQMGDISNLITDMTIRGASTDELARAVKHSMVVIDAEKHSLNYKQSAIDNGIKGLKKKYQGRTNAGATTLISKASSVERVGTRKVKIDPKTGKKTYEYKNETYVNKKGDTVLKTTKSTKMYETDDAFTLSSGTPTEAAYASHANKLKGLANKARKEALATKPIPYSPSAKAAYAKEVSALNSKLNIARKNKPLERQAQLVANKIVAMKKDSNPHMEPDKVKKVKAQALNEARARTGAKKQQIDIQPKEWEAIQAGAISTNKLKSILDNTDLDRIKELATPRSRVTMTQSKINRAKSMLRAGRTQAEIADALGVSASTISKID